MKPEFHQSMLGLLSKCGQAAYYRFVEGIRAPPGVAAHTGTGCHRSAHANLHHKREHGGLPLDADSVAQAAAEGFDVAWERNPPLMDERERANPAKTKGKAKDDAIKLALIHALDIAPQIPKPVHLEHKIVLELPDAPFNLGGTIDIVEERPDGKIAVRDTKTTGRVPKKGSAARSVQLQLYGWMYEAAKGKRAEVGALDTVVRVRNPYASLDEAPLPTDYSHLFRRIEAAAKVFETGAFMPVDPTGPDAWICSPKWCGYWSICPYGERAMTQHPTP